MSLYIEFEPHSWYKGFAIRDNKASGYDSANLENKLENGYRYTAYTDDGMTYRIVEKQADTLKQLKQQITDYRNKQAEKIAEHYKILERTKQ